jgi:hypothetical protein
MVRATRPLVIEAMNNVEINLGHIEDDPDGLPLPETTPTNSALTTFSYRSLIARRERSPSLTKSVRDFGHKPPLLATASQRTLLEITRDASGKIHP